MTTAILILFMAVVTLLCVNRVLRSDMEAMRASIVQLQNLRDELRSSNSDLRRENSGLSTLEDLQSRERMHLVKGWEEEVAELRAKSIEIVRQVKQRVQPMILILRPMLAALEAMELPEFDDQEASR